MCALFGPRLDVHRAELALEPHVWPEPLGIRPARHSVPMLASTVQLGQLGETTASVRPWPAPALDTTSTRPPTELLSAATAPGVALGLAVLGRAQPLPPLGTASRVVADLTLEGQAHDVPVAPRVRVRQALSAMRERPVERRSVPARLLTDAQQAYWRKRLGDAKRVPGSLIDLVAIFPDVPIVGDQPVQYAHGILSYQLPEAPVPLTTVVIAKHRTRGELLLGRFSK